MLIALHGIDTPAAMGDAMRHRRKQLGMTQGELASAAGVSRGWVSRAENGKPRTQWDVMFRVLAVLSVQISLQNRDAPRPAALDRRRRSRR